MNTITRNQWIAIALLILSVNMGATAQLSDLFGVGVAKIVVSLSSLGSSILAGIQIILGGQNQQVLDVKAMPGVENITVNAQASSVLAKMAVDPKEDKVTPASHMVEEVTQIAKGN